VKIDARRDGAACAQPLEALPALLSLAREVVVTSFAVGDPESDELKSLLEACVVGAYRLRLRERLRGEPGCSQP
jgi:hypothetical protein